MSIYSGVRELRRLTKRVTCFCSWHLRPHPRDTKAGRLGSWGWDDLESHTNCMSDSCYSVHWDGNTYMWPLCGLGFYISWWPWDNWISYWNSTEINFFLIFNWELNFFLIPSSEAQCSKSQCSRKKRWKLSHLYDLALKSDYIPFVSLYWLVISKSLIHLYSGR